MRLLLVAGDFAMANALNADLRAKGFSTEVANTGEEALDLVRHYEFDLLLLSLTLPDMDGCSVIRRIRTAGRTVSILALSTSRDPRARVNAFSAGADDVVDQRVDPTELLARIGAIVRRTRGHSHFNLQIGAVSLNLDRKTVSANGTDLSLTAKEYALLQLLMLRKNMVMTKETILTQLYGGMDEPEPKIIDVFVCKIRKKLAKVGLADFVGTVWGRGYTVRDQADSSARPATPSAPEPMERQRRLVLA